MSNEKTEPNTITSPISQVNNRVMPVQSVKQAKSGGVDRRIGLARRAFASLVAAAENPPLQVRGNFEISGLGKLRTGVLRNFRLSDEKGGGRTGFTVSFEQQGREGLKHVTESEAVHKALRKALYAHDLVFRSASSMTAYKIELDPVVPAWIMISGEPDGKTIAVQMHNVAMLGSTTYELPVDAVDRKLVDALVALLSGGDRSFYDLAARARERRG